MLGRNKSTRAATASGDIMGSAARSPFGRLCQPAGPLAMLAIAGLLSGVSPAIADPPSTTPQADRVFADCRFTTDDLNDALHFSMDGEEFEYVVQVSYILVYARENPNDGQPIDGGEEGFTGPVLCINDDTEEIDQTTETTVIPNSENHGTAESVDILDTEEAFHLRYQLISDGEPGQIEKRVCHTVAGNTDCFFIQPAPIID